MPSDSERPSRERSRSRSRSREREVARSRQDDRDDEPRRSRHDDNDDSRSSRKRRVSPEGRERDPERERPSSDSRRDGERSQRRDRDRDYRRTDSGNERERKRSRSPSSQNRSRDSYRDNRDSRDSRRDYDRSDRRDRRDDRDGDRRRTDDRSSRNNDNHGLPPLQTEPAPQEQEVAQFVPPTRESILADRARAAASGAAPRRRVVPLIEVIANDRLGGKVRVKCSPKDTVGDLKKLIAAQKGTKPEKIVLKKWYTIYKDHVTLEDYEINDGMSLEMN